jgi:hypothetical protein
MAADDGESVKDLKAIGRKVLGFAESNRQDERANGRGKDALREECSPLSGLENSERSVLGDDRRSRDVGDVSVRCGHDQDTENGESFGRRLAVKHADEALNQGGNMGQKEANNKTLAARAEDKDDNRSEMDEESSSPALSEVPSVGGGRTVTRTRSLERDLQWSVAFALQCSVCLASV